MSDASQCTGYAEGTNLTTGRSGSDPVATDQNYVFHDSVGTVGASQFSALRPTTPARDLDGSNNRQITGNSWRVSILAGDARRKFESIHGSGGRMTPNYG
jgi:hypothetical protein